MSFEVSSNTTFFHQQTPSSTKKLSRLDCMAKMTKHLPIIIIKKRSCWEVNRRKCKGSLFTCTGRVTVEKLLIAGKWWSSFLLFLTKLFFHLLYGRLLLIDLWGWSSGSIICFPQWTDISTIKCNGPMHHLHMINWNCTALSSESFLPPFSVIIYYCLLFSCIWWSFFFFFILFTFFMGKIFWVLSSLLNFSSANFSLRFDDFKKWRWRLCVHQTIHVGLVDFEW